ncbi:MAG: hypothetical protein LQ343_007455 [Gyalolechia ehrenbergii]|nr:MAG: hypothetical protein LQ343_007455 [Gyalolechia ehrenbergii]
MSISYAQSQSPLFNRIPPEVRDQIFKLALTAYEDPSRKIDTDLLLTCRRIYWETFTLPASINEHTLWYGRAPPSMERNHFAVDNRLGSTVRRRHLRTVHVFTQQVWLESAGFASFTGLWEYACPTTLIITLRHSDWWWWEYGEPLCFDPKQEGRALRNYHSRPSDPFAPRSWGNQFRKIKGLEKLQIELETVEKTKNQELDAIVDRAEGWVFPLGDDRVLRLNKSKTQRDIWVGVRLDEDNEEGQEEEDIIRNIPHIPFIESEDEDDEGSVLVNSSQPSTGANAEDLALTPDQPSPTDSQTTLQHPPADDIDMPNPSGNQVGELTKALRIETMDGGKLEAEGVVFNDAGLVKGLPLAKTSKYYVVTLTWEAQEP